MNQKASLFKPLNSSFFMKVTNVRFRDAEEVFELFKSAQIGRENLGTGEPSKGFFEYHLSFQDIEDRLRDPRFSFSLRDNNGRILAYLLAYPLSSVNGSNALGQHVDPVIKIARQQNPDFVYVDQVFIAPQLPAFVAGRLFDMGDYTVQRERIPGAITAIPQSPWVNQASTRFAIARGFSREGTVKSGEVELSLFSKPYWKKGKQI